MLKTILKSLFCLFIITAPAWSDEGQNIDKQKTGTAENPFIVTRTEGTIKVDGRLDEADWKKAAVLELNYEVSPRENVRPPVRTEVRLLYNRSHFYIGFRCFDPEASKIRGHYSERDRFSNDDWVAVEIDTYNDSRRAFTLFSTSVGVQMDGISDAAGIKDYNWDMIYNCAGKIYDWGYGVEIAIPFSSLRFQRTKESQIWGINIVRGYPRNVAHQIWAQPYDRGNTCRVCQYLKIKGFKGVSPGRNLELNPTITALTTDERENLPDGEFTNRDKSTELGITTRWGITPNLILSAAVNPDFSQVEADSPQLDINQPFALFYPERRPFFTEGLDFFRSPLNVIYTRVLRNPLWGIKLSGKEGANGIGAYVVRDEITNLIFPGNQFSTSMSMAEANTATVIRYERDLWNNSTVGLIFTNRDGQDYFNRVLGLDGKIRVSQKDEINLQLLGSSTQYGETIAEAASQPQGEFKGEAISAVYTRKTKYHQLDIGYLGMGNRFRADLGFIPQVGIRRYDVNSNYTWIAKKKSWWTRLQLSNNVHYMSDSDGKLLDTGLYNSFTFRGGLQSTVTIANTASRQQYNGEEFDLLKFSLSASANLSANLYLGVTTSFGDSIDYVNTRKGSKWLISPLLTVNIGMHLRLNLNHTFETMDVNKLDLYSANISQATIIYHFNNRMFIRSILQYYDYRYNDDNYLETIADRSSKFFTQVLFSYKINPRTVLFLGYSDNYFGSPEFGLTKKDYTLFFKIGYAWVM